MFLDGGAVPNPGTGSPSHRSGCGVLYLRPRDLPDGGGDGEFDSPDDAPDEYDGKTLRQSHYWCGRNTTNNESEYWSLLNALHFLDTKLPLGATDSLLFVMDSELVVKQMKGEYECRNRRLGCLKTSADVIVARLRGNGVSVKFVHRKREHNTRADALATLAMAPGHGRPIPDGLLRTVRSWARPYPLAASHGESDSDSDDTDDNSSPPFSAEECVDEQYTWRQLREMMGDLAVVDGYGMLGAALGVRDAGLDFMSEHVRERTRRAVSLTTKLHQLDDSWCAFLLLRFVGSARMRFTPRVMPYTKIGEFIQTVDNTTTAELSRNLGVVGGISEAARDQASLPPKEGGLGLPRCSDTAPAACIASWSAVMPLLKQHLQANPNFTAMYRYITRDLMSEHGEDPLGVVAAHAKLKTEERWLNDRANAKLVNPENPDKAKAPVALGSTAKQTLTKTKKQTEWSLSLLVSTRVKAQLLGPYDDHDLDSPYTPALTNADRRRILSCGGHLAHEFIGMAPRLARVGVTPPVIPGEGFMRVLQFRLGLPQSYYTSGGRTCRCGRAGDVFGDHSIGCKFGGLALKRHNGPVRTLCAMFRRIAVSVHSGGHYPPLEDPPEGEPAHNYPDFVVSDYPDLGDTAVCDVTIYHPNTPSAKARDRTPHTAIPLATAVRAAREKVTKYEKFLRLLEAEQGRPRPASEHFVPLAMETYGAVSTELYKMFQWLIKTWVRVNQASPSQEAYYRHEWKYRFSTSVQMVNAKMLADAGTPRHL